MTEDTDNETGQVLKGMDFLPPILRRYVREDNRWFQQELREWEEQFCQAQREEVHQTNTEEPVPEQPQNPDQEPAHENTHEEQTPDPISPAPAQQCEGQGLFYKR